MRTYLLLLTTLLSSNIILSQTTNIPDPLFEQELINLGYDTGLPDGLVPTANIDTITFLSVYYKNINDLTGIEDFAALTGLNCSNNNLTSLDVTPFTDLTFLACGYNQLSNLDVSQNTALTFLECSFNSLSSLNLTQNTALTLLNCFGSQLNCLNIKNGNNINFTSIQADNNPNLACIEVDDVAYSTTNWIGSNFSFHIASSFSENCQNSCSVGINENYLTNFSIYPNPTTGSITIDLDEIKTNLEVTLTNNIGQVIFAKQFKSTNLINIDLNNLKGIYFLQLETENGEIITRKIVKE
jgi:hypothetical protein